MCGFCCFILHWCFCSLSSFFFNDTATTEIYTLSLHDALPISSVRRLVTICAEAAFHSIRSLKRVTPASSGTRSEEHTSELQSRVDLVCRLLLEKKKKKKHNKQNNTKHICNERTTKHTSNRPTV